MSKDESSKADRIKGWREKRAAKRALRGDSPERLAEPKRQGDQPTVKDSANRAGLGGFVGGG